MQLSFLLHKNKNAHVQYGILISKARHRLYIAFLIFNPYTKITANRAIDS